MRNSTTSTRIKLITTVFITFVIVVFFIVPRAFHFSDNSGGQKSTSGSQLKDTSKKEDTLLKLTTKEKTTKEKTTKENTDEQSTESENTTKKKNNKPNNESSTTAPTETIFAGDEDMAEFFKDSLFIGDSRTEGLLLYSKLPNWATFYSKVGLNVKTAQSDAFINLDGETLTIFQALEKKKYKRIYLSLGVNELNWPSEDVFYEEYKNVVDGIAKRQPDATIYIQSIIHVSQEHSDSEPLENNARVNAYNKVIKTYANGKNIKYINLNPCFDDENHALVAESTTDGIHMKPQYYELWVNKLMQNP